jgi:hypothetical protein
VRSRNFSDSPLEPHSVRVKAECRDARNMVHATAVEFGRFDVIELDGGP